MYIYVYNTHTHIYIYTFIHMYIQSLLSGRAPLLIISCFARAGAATRGEPGLTLTLPDGSNGPGIFFGDFGQ